MTCIAASTGNPLEGYLSLLAPAVSRMSGGLDLSALPLPASLPGESCSFVFWRLSEM